jgi:hypothetical protein
MIPQAPRAGAKTQEAKAGDLSRVASVDNARATRANRCEGPGLGHCGFTGRAPLCVAKSGKSATPGLVTVKVPIPVE